MEDNENKIFEENTYWPQTLGDEAVGKKLDILHTSNPTETASVIAEKEKKIYDRPAEAFKILPEDLSEVYVGTETQLELVPIVDEGDEAPNSPTVVWESSDLNVAFVGDGNILGALSEGSATITATDINNPEVAPVSKEVTVLVFGKRYTFTIIFTDGDNVISTVSGETGTPVELPVDLEKEGYTFKGWSIDGENIIIPISNIGDSDITYIAVWEEVVVPETEYTITFRNGDNVVKTITGVTGTPVELPTGLSKEGYVFEGWSIDGENIVTPVSIIGSSDVTYFAVWSVIESPFASEYFNITVLSEGTVDDVPRILPSNTETYYYSYDKETWTGFDDPLNIHEGDIIYFKGNGGTGQVKNLFTGKSWSEVDPDNDMKLKISGNILSLVYSDNFYNATFETCPKFNYFFSYEGSIVDASDLVLPNKVSSGCFSGMFHTCNRLETPPSVLPAMILANGCYNYMFENCTSLTTAPELPATTLAPGCYQSMFNCCTSLTSAPELPATTLAEDCYDNMFYGCSSIITAPELPATTLVNSCYYQMFYNCTSLNYIKCLAIGEFGENSTNSWVYNVSDIGTFVVNENSTYDDFQWEEGDDGVPYGWVILFPDGTPVSGGSSSSST